MEAVTEQNQLKFIEGMREVSRAHKAQDLEQEPENGFVFIRIIALTMVLVIGASFGFVWGRYWH